MPSQNYEGKIREQMLQRERELLRKKQEAEWVHQQLEQYKQVNIKVTSL